MVKEGRSTLTMSTEKPSGIDLIVEVSNDTTVKSFYCYNGLLM